jgi:hypothetical protein
LSARFSLLGAKTLWGFVATVWSANMPCVKWQAAGDRW